MALAQDSVEPLGSAITMLIYKEKLRLSTSFHMPVLMSLPLGHDASKTYLAIHCMISHLGHSQFQSILCDLLCKKSINYLLTRPVLHTQLEPPKDFVSHQSPQFDAILFELLSALLNKPQLSAAESFITQCFTQLRN